MFKNPLKPLLLTASIFFSLSNAFAINLDEFNWTHNQTPPYVVLSATGSVPNSVVLAEPGVIGGYRSMQILNAGVTSGVLDATSYKVNVSSRDGTTLNALGVNSSFGGYGQTLLVYDGDSTVGLTARSLNVDLTQGGATGITFEWGYDYPAVPPGYSQNVDIIFTLYDAANISKYSQARYTLDRLAMGTPLASGTLPFSSFNPVGPGGAANLSNIGAITVLIDSGRTPAADLVFANLKTNGINDQCPSDPYKTSPGVCGCGVADTDTDHDGIPDCIDTDPKCRDGIDNDNDGAIDFPADFSCSSSQDDDETYPKAECQDGLDNDADGKIDYPADPGCSSAQDNDERNPSGPACDDGRDNDGDGKIDYPSDSGCTGPTDPDETNAVCSDGLDNDSDGKIDFPSDSGCSDPNDPTEDSERNNPPSAPINVQASDGTFLEFVQVSWSASPTAESYQLFRSQFPNSLGEPLGVATALTLFNDTSAVPGVIYYYTVKAQNSFGVSGVSNTDPGYRQCPSTVLPGQIVSDTCATGPQLRSPAFGKFNTFLGTNNFLELVNSGASATSVKVTLYTLDGNLLTSRDVVISGGQQFDLDINNMFMSGCHVNPYFCSAFVDNEPAGKTDGVFESYGLVKLEWNDKATGVTIAGRMSLYRPDPDGSYSFAYAKELRNPTFGTTFGTTNTIDPQGGNNETPNWVEIINLDSRPQAFEVIRYSQDGTQLSREPRIIPPLGEYDIQGGHQDRDTKGTPIQSVYSVEIRPVDGSKPYFSSVARYSANSTVAATSATFNFGFGIDGRAGATDVLFAPVSNELVTGSANETLSTVSSWVEIVNTREVPTTVSAVFISGSTELTRSSFQLAPKAQFHLNGSTILAKGTTGVVYLSSTVPGALLANSLAYYHSSKTGLVQSAYGLAAKTAGSASQAGSVNTNLGMKNIVTLFSTGAQSNSLFGSIKLSDGKTISVNYPLSGFGTLTETMVLPNNAYGALMINSNSGASFGGLVMRIRIDASGADFVMPTVIQ